ncbi:MAG TPA: acyltransferase [Xanthobacteraceae bacterium]|jgi:peptidoglycan/LPS O-acetylase OafA/YrhL|nr:acyltransferase [Xanthobacteraceae bacterium]
MGTLRLILALAVVVDHAPQQFSIRIAPGDVAVEMFFMISGFYMALILSTRYSTKSVMGISAFYLARFLRLWPAYAITAAFLYSWLALVPLVTGHPSMGPFVTPPRSSVWQALIGLSNLTMIGQDVLTLFHVTPHGDVTLTFGAPAVLDDGSQSLGYARIVGQAWSIGAEIWFYLLVPLLIRLNSLFLTVLLVASLALRVLLGEYFNLTIYFFFPAQLSLFLAGILAYRWRDVMIVEGQAFAFGGLSILIVLVASFQILLSSSDNEKWILYFLLFLFMPTIFEEFQSNAVDRGIGELSYPIYITHRGIFAIVGGVWMKFFGTLPPGSLMLMLVVGSASVLYFTVDAPVDRLRHRLVRNWIRARVSSPTSRR